MLKVANRTEGKGWKDYVDRVASGEIKSWAYVDVVKDNGVSCYRGWGDGRLTFWCLGPMEPEQVIGDREWYSFHYESVPDEPESVTV
jgi:hypothetical protein